MKNKKILLSILVIGFCAGAVWSAKAFRPSALFGSFQDSPKSMGNPKAQLNVVEYFDYQCGACQAAYLGFKEYFQKYPGAIRLEARFFPLPAHPHGLQAAICAQCAAEQGKFWPFHDLVFEKQSEWAPLPDVKVTFQEYAGRADLDLNKWSACIASPDTEVAVMKERSEGTALDVKLTPSFMVNGKFVVGADHLTEELRKFFGEAPATDPGHAQSPASH